MPDTVNETIRLTGFDELERKLESLPPIAAREALRDGLQAGGEVFREEMAARVRQGWHHGRGKHAARVFGFLAHSEIEVTHIFSDFAGSAQIGPAIGGFWARFLEFGTRTMPAFPFIRISFESRKYEALEKFKEATTAAIDRAGLRIS